MTSRRKRFEQRNGLRVRFQALHAKGRDGALDRRGTVECFTSRFRKSCHSHFDLQSLYLTPGLQAFRCTRQALMVRFSSYLGSPRLSLTSGLYLHSPALEGLWMEA